MTTHLEHRHGGGVLGDSLKTIINPGGKTQQEAEEAAGSGTGSEDPATLVEPKVENTSRMLPAPNTRMNHQPAANICSGQRVWFWV